MYKLSHDFLRLQVGTRHVDANNLASLEMDDTSP